MKDARDRQPPELSVVVPVHRGADLLPDTLGALRESDLPEDAWELIVVDDASGDRTPMVADAFADRVVRLTGDPLGPAGARNRGAAAASGRILAFVDADVRVRPDTLRRLRDALPHERKGREAPPGAPAAVFGSYDDRPPAPGIVSRYRNLLHHRIHQRHPGEAETFWAGCAAILRAAFEEVGGFDEEPHARPQAGDIELGCRLRALGHRIELRPEIQVTHLKRWTLREVIRSDFRGPGMAWTRLLPSENPSAATGTLKFDPTERWCAVLAVGATAATVAGGLILAVPPGPEPPGPESGLLAVLAATELAGVGIGVVLLAAAALWLAALGLLQADFYRLLWRRGRASLLVGGVALHLLHYLTAAAAALIGAGPHVAGR